MKKTICIILAAACLASCQSFGKPKAEAPKAEAIAPTPAPVEIEKASDSYAFGLLIGDNMKTVGVPLDYEDFMKGLKAGCEAKDMMINLEEANTMAQAAVQNARKRQGEENQAAEKKFFEENKAKAGVVTTDSGLQYQIVTEGTGPKPAASDTVSVDYEGKLRNGKVFDSSIARGEPISIRPDQVIPGWTEALQLMNVGSKYTLYIPSSLAYGENGAGEDIGPYETLIFEVNLLAITPPVDESAIDGEFTEEEQADSAE